MLRTTSQSRILDSARYWSLGAFGWNAPELINLEVQIEGDGFNTSLASYDTCNNSNTIDVAGGSARRAWPPATWELTDVVQARISSPSG